MVPENKNKLRIKILLTDTNVKLNCRLYTNDSISAPIDDPDEVLSFIRQNNNIEFLNYYEYVLIR